MTAAVASVRPRTTPWLAGLLAVYLLATGAVLLAWHLAGSYPVTGDEPHYLVIADGLVRHGSLDVAVPYAEEFAGRAIYAPGLAAPGTIPAPPFAHVVDTDAGMFSWHGAGLPFLLAVPFALLGVGGAKAVMVVLGALVVVVAWRVSAVFLASPRARFAATAACALAYPLVPASTQVYPDLVAGLLILSVVYLLLTVAEPRRSWSLAAYSLLIGALPWLGQKFVLPALVLGIGTVVIVARSTRSWSRVAWVAVPAIALAGAQGAANLLMFGSVTGSPAEGALEPGRDAVMVLWGLLADQDQGFLIQNPVLWAAAVGLVILARSHRAAFVVWALAFASVWIPGALHPGLYGLGSFVGRYSWALAVLAIVPAMAALGALSRRAPRAFAVVTVTGIVLNAAIVGWASLAGGAAPGAPAGFDLYTKAPDTWLESYAVFTFPLQDWFPALYDASWAFSFWPNAAWLLVLAGAIVAGARPRGGAIVAVAGALAVLVAGIVAVPGPRSQTVAVDRTAGFASGYLSGEPVRQMRQGPYTWAVTYSAVVPDGSAAGRWELVQSTSGAVVAAGELPGTAGAVTEVPVVLPYLSLRPVEYSLRVATYGRGPFTLVQTSVAHGSAG